MHFEYIASAVSQGLMHVQLNVGVPIVFGLLTCLDERQARQRAGLSERDEGEKAPGLSSEGAGQHCHGEDWGNAAIELGVKNRVWAEGGMA